MEDKIKELVFKRQPVPEVVTMLEQWLEQAKQGEFVGIAIAGAKYDGSQSMEFNSSSKSLLLNSAVHTLAWRVQRSLMED